MSASFRHRMAVWGWNGFNAAVSGLCTGLTTVLGIDAVNVVFPGAIHSTTPRQFLATCLVATVSSLVMYVRNNKLPSLDTDNGSTPLPPGV